MELWQEALIAFFLIVAGLFGLIGSLGLIKLPNPMTRLHAPTKATTLGVGGALIASMLQQFFGEGAVSFHELIITVFLFLTAPITAHFIAKVHLHHSVPPGSVPDTGTGKPWAGRKQENG